MNRKTLAIIYGVASGISLAYIANIALGWIGITAWRVPLVLALLYIVGYVYVAISGKMPRRKTFESATSFISQRRPVQRKQAQRPQAQRQPIQRQPIQRQPIQRQPIQRQPIQHQPVQRPQAQRQPAQRQPAQRQPAQRQPAQRQPAQRQPARFVRTGDCFVASLHGRPYTETTIEYAEMQGWAVSEFDGDLYFVIGCRRFRVDIDNRTPAKPIPVKTNRGRASSWSFD